MIHEVVPTLRRSRLLHWLTIAIVLWMSYGWGAFNLPPNYVDTYSEQFVVRKIEAGSGLREDVPGGFLLLPPENAAQMGGAAYRANPGWQGMALSALHRATGGSINDFVRASKIAYALLWSLVASAFVMLIWRHFGTTAAAFAFASYLLSATMVAMSVNLYWCLFIVGTVALVAWIRIERESGSGRLSHRTFAILGGLVFLKSLTGYEWITTVALTCCVPLVFFALTRRWSARTFFRNATWIMTYCIAGFAVALAIHMAQGVIAFGSVNEALKPVLSRAMAHTYGNPTEAAELYYLDPKRYPTNVPWLTLFYQYLIYPIVGAPGLATQGAITLLTAIAVFVGGVIGSLGVGRPLRGIPARIADIGIPILFAAGTVVLALLTLVVLPDRSRVPDPVIMKVVYRSTVPLLYAASAAVLAAISWRVRARVLQAGALERTRLDPLTIPLLATAGAAFVAALSWLILAKSHAAVHTVLNIVTFGILFTPLVAAWVGMTLEGVFRHRARQPWTTATGEVRTSATA